METRDGRPLQPDWNNPADAESIRLVVVPMLTLDDIATSCSAEWYELVFAFDELVDDEGKQLFPGDFIRWFLDQHAGVSRHHTIAYCGKHLLGCVSCLNDAPAGMFSFNTTFGFNLDTGDPEDDDVLIIEGPDEDEDEPEEVDNDDA